MDLLLIRHALPVRVEQESGAADPDLSEHGRAQAEALAAWLAGEPIDSVVTSPMARAVQTGRPLAEHLGVEPVVEEGIAEFDRDATSYVPIEELKEEDDPRWHALVAGEFDRDFEAFARTAINAVERTIDANAGRVVAAVCHGGVINTYLADLLGIDRPMFFEPSYTGITRLRAARNGLRSLVSVNETPHLRGVGLTPTPDN